MKSLARGRDVKNKALMDLMEMKVDKIPLEKLSNVLFDLSPAISLLALDLEVQLRTSRYIQISGALFVMAKY
jgi:hypothetical protein